MYIPTNLSSQLKYKICYHSQFFLVHICNSSSPCLTMYFYNFFFFGLTCFTQCNDFWIHPCCFMCQNLTPFIYVWVLDPTVRIYRNLSFHLPLGICVVSSLFFYNEIYYEFLSTSLCVDIILSFPLGKYLEVELLEQTIKAFNWYNSISWRIHINGSLKKENWNIFWSLLHG